MPNFRIINHQAKRGKITFLKKEKGKVVREKWGNQAQRKKNAE